MVSAADYLRKVLLSPVYEAARVTPLQTLKKLSERLGNHVSLKREDLQPVHSFKLRGAYHKIATLTEEQKARGVIAASAGNHAQGVALSAAKLGIKAIIVMPKTTPDIKIDAVRRQGGNVMLFGNSFDEAYGESRRLSTLEGYTLIPPFDDVEVIAGQGTIGKELLEQDTHLTHVFVPVGGGGLGRRGGGLYQAAAAGCEGDRGGGGGVRLPQGRAGGWRAGQSGAGLAVCGRGGGQAHRRGDLPPVQPVSGRGGDRLQRPDLRRAERHLRRLPRHRRAVGALSLAGLKAYSEREQVRGGRMAAILSGANVNFHSLRYVSERCEIGEKREGMLAVTIPERKGAFLDFCRQLGPRMVTEFNYRYADAEQASLFVSVRLTGGDEELGQIIDQLGGNGYPVVNMTESELAKNHVRYMIGGRPARPLGERLYSFKFPEQPGALMRFLETLGCRWNISLFHYRNHGADYGRVLCAFELPDEDVAAFHDYLREIGYGWKEVSDDPAYRLFLAS